MDDTWSLGPVPFAAHDRNLRLLPRCIEWHAENNGGKHYARRTIRQQDGSLTLQPITYTEFARAIDRASWWLDSCLLAGSIDTFAYLGAQDIRWTILFVAAIKSRRKMAFVSPWALPSNAAKMLADVDRLALIYDEPTAGTLYEGLKAQLTSSLKVEVPSLKYFLSDDPQVTYRYDETWDQSADKVVALFHTSGTTGVPRPVALSNRRIWVFGAAYLAHLSGEDILVPDFVNELVLTTFYISHIGGISTQLIWPVYLGSTFLTCPVGEIISPALIDSILRQFPIKVAALTPFLLHELASQSAALATLRNLRTIATGGSPVLPKIVDVVCANGGPGVQNFYGCTESWPSMQATVARHLPQCIALHPLGGADMVHHSENFFEFVVQRDKFVQAFQPAFQSGSSKNVFHSGDLFTRHPTAQEHWVFHGRADDMIILSNNQNVHVLGMEGAIMEDERIGTALIGGSGRAAPMLILELSAEYFGTLQYDPRTIQDNKESIWSAVQPANLLCSPNAALRESLILIADRPLIRTTKGSLDRSRSWKLFEHRINEAYASYSASIKSRGQQLTPNP